MSIQAKQVILKDVKENVDEFLTQKQALKVVDVVNDVLVDYEVEEVKNANDSTSNDLIKAFLEAKEIEGRSDKTLNRYSYMLQKAVQGMGVSIPKVTVFHVRSYLMSEKKRGLSDQSLEGVRSILSTFFAWLFTEGLIKSNPVANIGSIKCQKQIKKPFTALELEQIKQACGTDKERALISFLRSTGCRVGEVCRLNRDSVDFANMECKVLGKGNKERIVYFDSITAMELKKYLSGRKDSGPCLFRSIYGRMTEQGVRYKLKELEEKSGVENIHPHRFRRTLATNLIDRGMPIQEVAFILGHDKIDTTMRYVYIEKENVRSAYWKYI